MAGTTVGNNQYACPLPRWAYPDDSPCAHTDDFHIGENNPAFDEAELARIRAQSKETGWPWWVYAGLIAGAVYLGIRGMEAFARVKEAWNQAPRGLTP